MKNSSYHAKNASIQIHAETELLLKQFNACRAKNQQIKQLSKKIEQLDEANEDYKTIADDKRETLKIYFVVISFIALIIVDCIVGIQAGELITHKFHLPSGFKYLLPIFLIVLEMTLAYFLSLRQQTGKMNSGLLRRAPYAVITILAVFSIMNVMYAIETFTPETDQMSFLAYLILNIAIQLVLLVASILMHIWIIKHTELLSEVFAFFHYKLSRRKYVKKYTAMTNDNAERSVPAFVQNVSRIVVRIEAYHRDYPQFPVDFAKSMPLALTSAINTVMGRTVFRGTSPS